MRVECIRVVCAGGVCGVCGWCVRVVCAGDKLHRRKSGESNKSSSIMMACECWRSTSVASSALRKCCAILESPPRWKVDRPTRGVKEKTWCEGGVSALSGES